MKGIVILMDICYLLKDFDCDLINWVVGSEILVFVFLIKVDKLK